METPWGLLRDLDLNDPELGAGILATDKHQLIEGLVVECLFDQIVAGIQDDSEGGKAVLLDIETAIVAPRRHGDPWLSFVLARSKGEGLGRYFQILEQCSMAHLVTFEKGELLCTQIHDRKAVHPAEPLDRFLESRYGPVLEEFAVSRSVRDASRQKSAFWGFISDYYKDRLGAHVILPRLFLNCGLQTRFRRLWNLDRILLFKDRLWAMEIKHKYPIQRPEGLEFGMNTGELKVLEMLSKAGLKCLHTLLVKPFWTKDVGSMYLLNDLHSRGRAALVSGVFGQDALKRILEGQSGRSGSHTSITGTGGLTWKTIALSGLQKVGLLSDGVDDLAGTLAGIMEGRLDPIPSGWLEGLRMPGSRT
ncbi:MAG: hypothetical protein RL318_2202 [Fibrobacterota bacterium]|jgi:hypothetical protein